MRVHESWQSRDLGLGLIVTPSPLCVIIHIIDRFLCNYSSLIPFILLNLTLMFCAQRTTLGIYV